jgi:hypothetical protein
MADWIDEMYDRPALERAEFEEDRRIREPQVKAIRDAFAAQLEKDIQKICSKWPGEEIKLNVGNKFLTVERQGDPLIKIRVEFYDHYKSIGFAASRIDKDGDEIPSHIRGLSFHLGSDGVLRVYGPKDNNVEFHAPQMSQHTLALIAKYLPKPKS